jgi:hypothetical protein
VDLASCKQDPKRGGPLRALALALLVCGAAVSLPASGGDAPADGWFPPLEGPLVLTSTFGEYRPGHFHTGLDLSTGGETGRPVRAVGAGRIVRLRAHATGYGRALYLRLPGGRVAVYAHMERFAPRLERILRREQEARGEYEADVWLPEGVPVRRGELLGWSGDTGAGPPHLHVEIRDGELPLNPLLEGIAAPDASPPRITALFLVALAPEAHVAGRPWIRIAPSSDRAVPVAGPVGLLCQVVDRRGKTGGRLAPLEVLLRCETARGESLVARRRFERLDFSRAREVRRAYDTETLLASDWPPPLRLFLWPPGSGDPSWVAPGDGWIVPELLSGPLELRIVARDAAGHAAEATCRLVPADSVPGWAAWATPEGDGFWVERTPGGVAGELVASPQRGELVSAGHLDPGRFFLPGPDRLGVETGGAREWLWTREGEGGRPELQWMASPFGFWLRVRDEGAWRGTPRLRLMGERDARRRVWRRLPGEGWWVGLGPEDVGRWERIEWAWGGLGAPGETIAEEGALLVVEGQGPGHWEDAVSGWSLSWPAGIVERPGLLRCEVVAAESTEVAWRPHPEAPTAWLPILSPALCILQGGIYPARAFHLRLAGIGGDPKAALFVERGEQWSYLSGSLGTGEAALYEGGTFVALRDTVPPWIGLPRPAPGEVLAAAPGTLAVAVGDAGTGFRPEDADIWMDGRAVLARYDPDGQRLLWEVETPLVPGRHTWRVRVVDRAGNVREARFEFILKTKK